MAGAKHGRLPVTVLLVAACFSHLLLHPLAAAADAVEGRDGQRNTERISGDLSFSAWCWF
jgi:hypothetical protein